jgi:hypothetical protein
LDVARGDRIVEGLLSGAAGAIGPLEGDEGIGVHRAVTAGGSSKPPVGAE